MSHDSTVQHGKHRVELHPRKGPSRSCGIASYLRFQVHKYPMCPKAPWQERSAFTSSGLPSGGAFVCCRASHLPYVMKFKFFVPETRRGPRRARGADGIQGRRRDGAGAISRSSLGDCCCCCRCPNGGNPIINRKRDIFLPVHSRRPDSPQLKSAHLATPLARLVCIRQALTDALRDPTGNNQGFNPRSDAAEVHCTVQYNCIHQHTYCDRDSILHSAHGNLGRITCALMQAVHCCKLQWKGANSWRGHSRQQARELLRKVKLSRPREIPASDRTCLEKPLAIVDVGC